MKVRTGRKTVSVICLMMTAVMAVLLSGCTTFDSFRHAFFEETDEDHMVSLVDINAYLEGKGIKPVDRKTLYSDFDELRTFGMDFS